MLRLNRKLQVRIPNKLAAMSAALLLCSVLASMVDERFGGSQSRDLTAASQVTASSPDGEQVTRAVNSTSGGGHRISLMIFRLR